MHRLNDLLLSDPLCIRCASAVRTVGWWWQSLREQRREQRNRQRRTWGNVSRGEPEGMSAEENLRERQQRRTWGNVSRGEPDSCWEAATPRHTHMGRHAGRKTKTCWQRDRERHEVLKERDFSYRNIQRERERERDIYIHMIQRESYRHEIKRHIYTHERQRETTNTEISTYTWETKRETKKSDYAPANLWGGSCTRPGGRSGGVMIHSM